MFILLQAIQYFTTTVINFHAKVIWFVRVEEIFEIHETSWNVVILPLETYENNNRLSLLHSHTKVFVVPSEVTCSSETRKAGMIQKLARMHTKVQSEKAKQ